MTSIQNEFIKILKDLVDCSYEDVRTKARSTADYFKKLAIDTPSKKPEHYRYNEMHGMLNRFLFFIETGGIPNGASTKELISYRIVVDPLIDRNIITAELSKKLQTKNGEP